MNAILILILFYCAISYLFMLSVWGNKLIPMTLNELLASPLFFPYTIASIYVKIYRDQTARINELKKMLLEERAKPKARHTPFDNWENAVLMLGDKQIESRSILYVESGENLLIQTQNLTAILDDLTEYFELREVYTDEASQEKLASDISLKILEKYEINLKQQ